MLLIDTPANTSAHSVPPCFARAVDLARAHDGTEYGVILAAFLASMLHPDMSCRAGELRRLPEDLRASALAVFEFFLTRRQTLGELQACFAALTLAVPSLKLPAVV